VGVLEMSPQGLPVFYAAWPAITSPRPTDPYVGGPAHPEACVLREGMQLTDRRTGAGQRRARRVPHVDAIEGMDPQEYPAAQFDELTPSIRLSTFASRPARSH